MRAWESVIPHFAEGRYIAVKKILSVFLLFLFIFFFGACGKDKETYTYNYIPYSYPKAMVVSPHANQAVTNGALFTTEYQNLISTEYKAEEAKRVKCLFNEETKVVMPLCFNVVCEHDTKECFANGYYNQLNVEKLSGIYEDRIFLVNRKSPDETKYSGTSFCVNYYTFDGILDETVVWAPEFINCNGEIERYANIGDHISLGSKLYINVEGSSDKSVKYSESTTDKWLVVFDIESKTFSSYPITPAKTGISYSLDYVSENYVSYNFEGIGYVLNLETGEITEYDCGEILDRMVSEGRLIRGFEIVDVNAIKDYFVLTYGSGKMFVRISTEEGFTPPDEEKYSLIDAVERFDYNGDTYYLGEILDGNRQEYISLLAGEKFILADKERYYLIYSETEKGLILEYVNILPDGTREPTYEIRKEGGREVQYIFPKKLAYVTKEDFLDGSVDEPWFYDPETYSFVQQ